MLSRTKKHQLWFEEYYPLIVQKSSNKYLLPWMFDFSSGHLKQRFSVGPHFSFSYAFSQPSIAVCFSYCAPIWPFYPPASPFLVSILRFPRTSCRHRVSLMTRDNGRLRNFGPPPPFAYCTAADIKLPSQYGQNPKPLDGAFTSQYTGGHCSLSVRSSNFLGGSGSWSLKRRRWCLFQSSCTSFQFNLVKI